jgi:crossover junction endodeoxyribonuclease RuvC
MGHARGVILLVARRNKMEVREFAANRVKQATVGHGHAAKGQMQRAIQAIWNLPELPEPPDVADALAVALCCANAMIRGQTSSIPQSRRRSSLAVLRGMGTSSMPRTVPVRL